LKIANRKSQIGGKDEVRRPRRFLSAIAALQFAICTLQFLVLGGCGLPNGLTLSGTLTEPAVTGVWFAHDDSRLLVRTAGEYHLVEIGGRSSWSAGPATPDSQVWVSPVSAHFVEADRSDGRSRGRLYDVKTRAWTEWFALGDVEAPPPADLPDLPPPTDEDDVGKPRLPKAEETWPADPLKFWIAVAAERMRARGKMIFEADVRNSAAAYDRSRAGFRLVNWSRPGRPSAPCELDSPRKLWRVHLEPVWEWDPLSGAAALGASDRYYVNIIRERLQTGRKDDLVDSSGRRLRRVTGGL
jgi:hypothetical protein